MKLWILRIWYNIKNLKNMPEFNRKIANALTNCDQLYNELESIENLPGLDPVVSITANRLKVAVERYKKDIEDLQEIEKQINSQINQTQQRPKIESWDNFNSK